MTFVAASHGSAAALRHRQGGLDITRSPQAVGSWIAEISMFRRDRLHVKR